MAQLINYGTAAHDGTGEGLFTALGKVSNTLSVDTLGGIALLDIPSTINALRTTGRTLPGDGGGALYARAVSAPGHTAKIQSHDGAWWEYAPDGPANLLVFGADPSGAASCTAAINDMIAYGVAKSRFSFHAPIGTYRVLTTPTPFPTGSHLTGDGSFQTVFVPAMTDGTACLKFGGATRAQFFSLGGFSVSVTSINGTAFAAGSVSGLNCIGIDAADGGANAQTRFLMHDMFVYGCAVGVDVYGWLIEASNVYFQCNELGFRGDTVNASVLNFHMENNRRDLQITNSFGVTFVNLHIEPVVANALASTINGCNGVTLTSPYFEVNPAYPRSVPILTVGGTTECVSFNMLGASVAGSNGMNFGVPPILLDRVNGGIISGALADGAQGYGFTTTANTKNITLQPIQNYYMLQDTSKSQGPAVNYFANPRFDGGLKGWGSLTATRAAVSLVSTPLRRGPNAVKVQAAAGAGFNYASFRITGPALTAVKGKTLRVGAWLWVPNLARFDEASRLVWPGISLQSYNGSVLVSSTAKTNAMVKNAWNHYQCTVAVQSDATYLDVIVFVNQDSATADGTEYLVIDEITLCEVESNYFYQYGGNYINSDVLPSFDGGRMRAFGTVATFGSSAGEIYSVGDIIMNSAVTALGTPGYVCTTGGAGGVAVWSNMPSLV
jgi:hypothetical protein